MIEMQYVGLPSIRFVDAMISHQCVDLWLWPAKI